MYPFTICGSHITSTDARYSRGGKSVTVGPLIIVRLNAGVINIGHSLIGAGRPTWANVSTSVIPKSAASPSLPSQSAASDSF